MACEQFLWKGSAGLVLAVCSILRCLKENSYEKLVMQVPGWKKVMGLLRDEEEEGARGGREG